MASLRTFVIAFAISVLAVSASADDLFRTSISDTLASVDAQTKLDKSVSFYFGDTPHPAVAQSFGKFQINTKASAFSSRPRAGQCERALLSNLLDIQQKAHALGADAAINIHSYDANGDKISATEIDCQPGMLMVGVSLDGEYVKLAR
jgi:hypothetical protein